MPYASTQSAYQRTGVMGNKLHICHMSQNVKKKTPTRNVQSPTQLEEMPELFILLPMPEKGRYR
jgi:hypothetical protein